MSRYLKPAAIALLLGIALLLPRVGLGKYQVHVLTLAIIWAIATLSLNLILGYTGQASLAHGAFMGIGAYAFGIFTERLGLNFWLALPVSCLVTAFLGLLLGLLSLRTKGPYFAIVTISFNFIVFKVFENWHWLSGGIRGQRVPRPEFLADRQARYYFALACLVLVLIAMRLIVKSLLGVTFMAIRSNESLAEASGINTFRAKLLSLVTSCFIVGLAGALIAVQNGQLDYTVTNYMFSFYLLIFLLIGGAATLAGPVVGAVGLYWLLDRIKTIGDYRFLIFGILLMVVIIYFPRGLAGGARRLWDWLARQYHLKRGEVPG